MHTLTPALSLRERGKSDPHPSPLPEGEGDWHGARFAPSPLGRGLG